MSKKTARGLFEVGRQARSITQDWDELEQYIKDEKLDEKYALHEADLEIMREGFDVVVRSPACPTPEMRFPFKVNGKSVTYGEVPPDYFRWFWKQEWKDKNPQIIRYIKEYKHWIRKKELDSHQLDDEQEKIMKEIGDQLKS